MDLWTQDAIAILKDRWPQADVSATQLADELALAFGMPYTKNAVISKAWRMGIKKDASARLKDPKPRARTKAAPRARQERQPKAEAPRFNIVVAEPRPETAVPFLEARSGQCRFIADDPLAAGTVMCCGGPTVPNSSYCAWHHARCYVPTKRPVAVPTLGERNGWHTASSRHFGGLDNVAGFKRDAA